MAYCTQCGCPIPDGDSFCTECGAPLVHPLTEAASASQACPGLPDWQPHTLNELRRWYGESSLPDSRMLRVFLGQKSDLPSSLGILFDDQTWFVYQTDLNNCPHVLFRSRDEKAAIDNFFSRFRPGAMRFLQRGMKAR